jgi:predicted transcriptional regulator
MAYPKSTETGNPILHELHAVGGVENVKFLYEKLIPYFPQLNQIEIQQIKAGENKKWRKIIQDSAKQLDAEGLITRQMGLWQITEKGKRLVETESEDFQISNIEQKEFTHREIQEIIAEIGQILGYSTELEFQYYDVVWRETSKSQRISHVFEVQSKGNIDSAFAKLKRAYDAQRSQPFLILSTERDTNRANQSLVREFREIDDAITILSFAEINRVYKNLQSIAEILPKFLQR